MRTIIRNILSDGNLPDADGKASPGDWLEANEELEVGFETLVTPGHRMSKQRGEGGAPQKAPRAIILVLTMPSPLI